MSVYLKGINVTQVVDACIILKKSIDKLSEDVREDISFQQVEAANFLIVELLKKSLFILVGTTAKPDVIRYIERAIERLSAAVNEEIEQEDVENVNDDVVDLLGAALNRLGYDRCAK